jgi:hypothetical protein
MTPAPTDLIPCPFKRGQVWENPDGLMMIVTSVREYGETYKVEYISEDGELGKFYGNDKAITDNCELMSDLVPSQASTGDAEKALLRLWMREGLGGKVVTKDLRDDYDTIRAALAHPAVPAPPTDKDARDDRNAALKAMELFELSGHNGKEQCDVFRLSRSVAETIRLALSAPASEAMLVELIRWQYENGPSVHIMPDCVQPNILKIREIIRDSK